MNRRVYIKSSAGAAMLASIKPAGSLFDYRQTASKTENHICIFSKHLQWLGFREMAILASDLGFTGIDLTVRKGGHVLPQHVKRDLPDAVKQIRDVGLEVPMITTGITDPDDPQTKDIIETAGKLGIKLYRSGWYRYENGVKVSEILKQAKKQLSKIQSINKANNIATSYQNHAGNFVGSSGWDILHILGDLDPKWIGVQFDIRHAMVEGPKSWPYIFELLAPYINSMDIKDFILDPEDGLNVVNVPLGKGLVEFDSFLKKTTEFDINVDYSIHYEYPLGGAEHGDRDLSISREVFEEKVESDLKYFKKALAASKK